MSETKRAKLIKFTKLMQEIEELSWICRKCDIEIDREWRDEASARARGIASTLENWSK